MMRHSVDRPWLLTLTTTFQEVDRFFLLLWVRRKGRWNQAFFFLPYFFLVLICDKAPSEKLEMKLESEISPSRRGPLVSSRIISKCPFSFGLPI